MLLLLTLWACAGGEVVSDGDPTIALLAPLDGETVCGDPLVVDVGVANIVLVAPLDDPEQAEPGTGHVDIMLNGQDADMVWETTAEIEDVEDGEYQLKVELSYADHTPVVPYAGDLIYVTVSDAVCP